MPPLNKRQRQIRRLAEERKQRLTIQQVDIDLLDDVIPSDDIDFGFEGMLSDPLLLTTRFERF